jgi:hypothetical protein
MVWVMHDLHSALMEGLMQASWASHSMPESAQQQPMYTFVDRDSVLRPMRASSSMLTTPFGDAGQHEPGRPTVPSCIDRQICVFLTRISRAGATAARPGRSAEVSDRDGVASAGSWHDNRGFSGLPGW